MSSRKRWLRRNGLWFPWGQRRVIGSWKEQLLRTIAHNLELSAAITVRCVSATASGCRCPAAPSAVEPPLATAPNAVAPHPATCNTARPAASAPDMPARAAAAAGLRSRGTALAAAQQATSSMFEMAYRSSEKSALQTIGEDQS